MAVTDRWHKSNPRPTDEPCKCGTARRPLYPTAEHPTPDRPGGKRWQVRYRDEADNQRSHNFTKRQGVDPETCADAFDAQVHSQLHAGTYVDPEAGRITLGTYATQWRSGLTSDPSTRGTIDKHLKHIADLYSRQMRPLSKSPSVIQQWIAGLEAKGLDPGYIKVIKDTLSTIFAATVDDGVVQRNPVKAKSVKPPTKVRHQITPWTPEMLAAAAEDLRERKQMAGVVWLAGIVGLRQGEVFGLAIDDIQFLGKDRRITVRRQVKRLDTWAIDPSRSGQRWELVLAPPKRGKERTIPLSADMAELLAEQIKASPPEKVSLPWKRPDGADHTANLLFARPSGLPWYGQAFEYLWRHARRAAGAPDGPDGAFHALRHSAGSAWLVNGTDIRAVSAWLGHNDPGFTLRTYTHEMPDAADVGRRAMDTIIQRAKITTGSALKVPSGGQS